MNCPRCNQPIDPKLLAQALAKRNSGKGSRPGSAKNARNPYGRKGKRCPTCGYMKEDARSHHGPPSVEEPAMRHGNCRAPTRRLVWCADTNAAGEGGAVLPITLGPEQGSVLNMPERTAFIRGGSRIVHIPLCRLTGELVRLLKRFLKTLSLPLNYAIRPFQFEVLATGIVGKHMPSTPPVLLSPAAFAFDLSLCKCHAPILPQKTAASPRERGAVLAGEGGKECGTMFKIVEIENWPARLAAPHKFILALFDGLCNALVVEILRIVQALHKAIHWTRACLFLRLDTTGQSFRRVTTHG